MIKKVVCLILSFTCLCSFSLLEASADYSLVFIHIGRQIPSYAETAIHQARLFNSECSIVLLANENAIKDFSFTYPDLDVTYVTCESLPMTPEHEAFNENACLDVSFREGFWRYTSERFLYLNDLMAEYHLENVFHLENDNMLYVDLSELLPVFLENYQGIAATFDNDIRCIPGFIFIKNEAAMKKLAECFGKGRRSGGNDMEVIAHFKNANDENAIDYLPIIHKQYAEEHPLINAVGMTVRNKDKYSLHIDSFDSIFDAAAIGQYIDGVDRRFGNIFTFINESCIFNPSFLSYEWHRDREGRRIPYAVYGHVKHRINNIHFHSKCLENYKS